MDYKKLIETAVDQKQETILSASDRIFDYAELGFHEFKSVKLLEEINERGTTVLVVTHNREIVNAFRKRVITMKKGVIVSDEQEGEYRNAN